MFRLLSLAVFLLLISCGGGSSQTELPPATPEDVIQDNLLLLNTNFWEPEYQYVGAFDEPYPVTIRVKNQSATKSYICRVQCYISNTTLGSQAWHTLPDQVLVAGETGIFTLQMQAWLLNLPAGIYWLTMTVDPQNAIAETDETDNEIMQNIWLHPVVVN